MKLSIITVSFNSEKTIEDTIKSVINQDGCEIEYIIVDGGSTDGTKEIINKYIDRISVFISEKDEGIYDAMNKGIKLASGDVVGIINSDDWYNEHTFEKVVECFNNNDVDLVYGDLLVVEENGKVRDYGYLPLELMPVRMAVPHPTVFVRREIYDRFGCFNLDFKIAGDYELMLRFYSEGVRFKHLDYNMALFRLGGLSSASSVDCLEETKKISYKYCSYADNASDIRKKIDDYYDEYYQIYSGIPIIYKEFSEDLEQRIIELNGGITKNVAIWGCGRWGKRFFELATKCGYSIERWVDQNNSGNIINNMEVMPPCCLKDYFGIVVICVKDKYDEISQICDSMGAKKTIDMGTLKGI